MKKVLHISKVVVYLHQQRQTDMKTSTFPTADQLIKLATKQGRNVAESTNSINKYYDNAKQLWEPQFDGDRVNNKRVLNFILNCTF